MDLSKFNIDNLSALELGNIGVTVVGLILLIASSFLSRRSWLLIEAFVQGSGGILCVIVPTFALKFYQFEKLQKDFTIEKADGVHMHLTRASGILMIGCALTNLRLYDRDSDPTVFTSIVSSKVVCYSLCVVNLAYSVLVYGGVEKSKPDGLWSYAGIMLYMGVAVLLSVVISGLIQLGRVQSWGGYPETFTSLNVHVRVDYFLTLLSGILLFALPHWFLELETTLERPGNLHMYLMRVYGILCIGHGLLMGRAPNFLRDDDKVGLLECRIVQNVLLMVACMYAHNSSNNFTNYFVFFAIGGTAVWTINAALGYWSVRGYPKLKLN